MRLPPSPFTVINVAIGVVAMPVFLAWLASGLLLGFYASLPLALHGHLLFGNLALVLRIRREQRHEIAALHRQLDQSRYLRAVANEDLPDDLPARPRIAARSRARRSLIHDN